MKLRLLLSVLAVLSVAAPLARAQDSTNAPPTTGSIFSDVKKWATAFDTNNTTLSTDLCEVWTGPTYQNNISVADSFGVTLNVWRPSAKTVLSVESVTENAGIAGTIVQQEAGLQFGVVMYDLKVGIGGGGGYSFYESKALGYIAADVTKMVAAHTFIGARIEAPIAKNPQPLLTIKAGVTF